MLMLLPIQMISILDAYVRPYTGAINDAFVLQDDNVKPHRARIVNAYIEQETTQRMWWTSRSPYLNHFEHIYNALEAERAAGLTKLEDFDNEELEVYSNKLN
ncbi:transposable element Tcb1 transposase [Trichonephila clavipes]|nr:transposable element Tcb1 transposase [Trichonephila clavipes]